MFFSSSPNAEAAKQRLAVTTAIVNLQPRLMNVLLLSIQQYVIPSSRLISACQGVCNVLDKLIRVAPRPLTPEYRSLFDISSDELTKALVYSLALSYCQMDTHGKIVSSVPDNILADVGAVFAINPTQLGERIVRWLDELTARRLEAEHNDQARQSRLDITDSQVVFADTSIKPV